MSVNLTKEQQKEIKESLGLGSKSVLEIETLEFDAPGVEIFLSSGGGFYLNSYDVVSLSFFNHESVEEFAMWCNRPKEEIQGLAADVIVVEDIIPEGKKASEILLEALQKYDNLIKKPTKLLGVQDNWVRYATEDGLRYVAYGYHSYEGLPEPVVEQLIKSYKEELEAETKNNSHLTLEEQQKIIEASGYGNQVAITGFGELTSDWLDMKFLSEGGRTSTLCMLQSEWHEPLEDLYNRIKTFEPYVKEEEEPLPETEQVSDVIDITFESKEELRSWLDENEGVKLFLSKSIFENSYCIKTGEDKYMYHPGYASEDDLEPMLGVWAKKNFYYYQSDLPRNLGELVPVISSEIEEGLQGVLTPGAVRLQLDRHVDDNPVEQPKHYEVFPDLESIDVIRATLTEEEFRGFCKGNTLKYRLRAGKKDDIHQDIAKAEQYVKIYNGIS